MRWPRICLVLAVLVLLTGCSDDCDGPNCPEIESPWQPPYLAPTTIANALFDLKVAYEERNAVMFQTILDPGYTYIFDPRDVGSGQGIPESWGLVQETGSAANLFGGVANADGYRCEEVTLNFTVGTESAGPYEGWRSVTISEVELVVQTRHAVEGDQLWYQVLGDQAEFQFVLTDEVDPGTDQRLWKIIRWKDRPVTGYAAVGTSKTEPTTWGQIKVNWR